MSKDFEIKIDLDNLPNNPGVYQFLNSNGKIIYVGKAKNLKNRVRSYFQHGKIFDAKTKALITNIANLEFIVVDTEIEALLLEDNLIKKYKPKYNVMLRDDKTFPYIKITKDIFPKIYSTRKLVKDGSKYFGPYSDVRNMKQILKLIRELFQIRTCNLNLTEENIEKKKFRVCLDYHINKCEGPCEGLISKLEYNRNIEKAIQILNGKFKDVERQLEQEMNEYAENLKFEKANIIKKRLESLKDYHSRQSIVFLDNLDRDVFGLHRSEEFACSIILKIREGKLIAKKHFVISNAKNLSDEEIIQRTLETYYIDEEFIPKDIYIPVEIEDIEIITSWLVKKREKTVEIHIPKLGDKKKIIDMANANAEYTLKDYLLKLNRKDQVIPKILLSLQRDLRLAKIPKVIECFDNSHLQGTDIVSSMVCFENGKPKKSAYRKFKAKEINQNDDFRVMRETVYRRYKRLKEENSDLPDLIVIDGGKGQLNAAIEALKELELFDKIQIIGLAKRLEEIFLPDKSESILLPRTSSSLKLIQQIRDEAHRFAITFHRKLRENRTITTELVNVNGIGKKTALKLLEVFGSIANILNANENDLLKYINKQKIESIKKHFESVDNNNLILN
jgi:excinuclease ABC subunit C